MKSTIMIAITLMIAQVTYAQTEPGSAVLVVQKPKEHNDRSLTRYSHSDYTFPDSIRVEFPDQHSILIFEFKTSRGAVDGIDFLSTGLKQVVESIKKGTVDLSKPHTVTVHQSGITEKKITISETKVATSLTLTDQVITELLPPGWDVNIVTSRERLHVYAQTFDELSAVAGNSLESVKTQIATRLQNGATSRKRMVGRFIIQKDAMTYNNLEFRPALDMLTINAGSGVGILGDKFYPELNAVLGLHFANHNNRRVHRIALTYNNLFLLERKADGGFKSNINSFLSLSWSLNPDDKHELFGFGAGYLIHREGDYFKGKTMKFFITKDIGSFNIAPEFYLTNGFKDLLMGIKLNYTF